MKRIIQYILFLVALACTACDFLYQPVTFDGEITKPQIVLTGTLQAGKDPMVFVNRSHFFQGAESMDSIWVTNPYNGEGYYERYERADFLTDATVEIRINQQGWEHMHLEEYPLRASNQQKQYCFVSSSPLRAGDLVEIRAYHPDFSDTAMVRQCIPSSIHATGSIKVNNKAKTIGIVFDLSGYSGDSTDMLRFTASTQYFEIELHYNQQTKKYYRDTVLRYHQYLYSQDSRFAQYSHTNKALSNGYYGTSALGLYAPISISPTHYELITPMIEFNYGGVYTTTATTIFRSIDIHVETVTIDEYLTWATLLSGHYINQSVPDYFKGESSDADEMIDVIESIQDMFDEMGNMEGVQLYDNVEGGIGHVSAVNTNVYIFYPDRIITNDH